MIALLVCLKYYYYYVNMNFCLESFGSEYSYHKKNYIEIMPSRTPHQKFFFIIYLLEDEQELSLGMLDTSPMYL